MTIPLPHIGLAAAWHHPQRQWRWIDDNPGFPPQHL